MCQLTLMKIRSNMADVRSWLYMQMFVNSATMNRDGFGIFGSNIISKSPKPLGDIDSLEDLTHPFDEVFDPATWSKTPILAHVRATTDQTMLGIEHNHPFFIPDGRFALAHNGRLVFKDDKTDPYKDVKEIDSKKFLIDLNTMAASNPELPVLELFQATISRWKGKFAFLIKDIKTGLYYVCRGESAELHVADVLKGEVRVGFIVNTKKEDILLAYKVARFYLHDKELHLGAISELEKNSVYVVSGIDLKRLGEMKETVIYAPPATSYYRGEEVGYSHQGNFPKPGDVAVLPGAAGSAKSTVKSESVPQTVGPTATGIAKYIEHIGLSIKEVDALCVSVFNHPLVGLTCGEKMDFIDLLKRLDEYYTPQKERIWRDIENLIYGWIHFDEDPYVETPVQFPWVLNTDAALQAALVDLQERLKTAEGK